MRRDQMRASLSSLWQDNESIAWRAFEGDGPTVFARSASGPAANRGRFRATRTLEGKACPTKRSQKPPYPESTRFAVDFYKLNETELAAVAGERSPVYRPQSGFSEPFDALFVDALSILLEFYGAQDMNTMEYLHSIASVSTASALKSSATCCSPRAANCGSRPTL